MNPRSIQEYAEAMRARYLKATKKQKGRLLEEFCETTGYHRKAAIRLLRQPPAKPIERRGRKCVYEQALAIPLKQVWEAANCICSKRLVPFLPELVDSLQRHNELHLEPDQHRLLLAMSPSTLLRRAYGHGPPALGESPQETSPTVCPPIVVRTPTASLRQPSRIKCPSAPSAVGLTSCPALCRPTWWPIAERVARASTCFR